MGLPTDTFALTVRSETARTELVACALMPQRCTAMTWPHRGRLDCYNTTTKVHRMLRRVRRGWWCTQLPRGALVARLADGAAHAGLMDPTARHFKIGVQDGATGGDVGSVGL